MSSAAPYDGRFLRSAVVLMLTSLSVMVLSLFSLYFAPLLIAPFLSLTFYMGLVWMEIKHGVLSPITLLMIIFYTLLCFLRFFYEDIAWFFYIVPAIYFTLSCLILGMSLFGKPFTLIYSRGSGFYPLHKVTSSMWGILHLLSGFASITLMPDLYFLVIPMILMLLGAIGTIVLHFISMGRSFRRQKSFLLGDFHFQQVQSEDDFHLFYKTISEAYRRDLQKIAGSKYNISTDQIEAEHRRSDAKRKNHIVPFLVFRKGTPLGGICLFLDHHNEGLPVEHEAKISVDKLRAYGSLVEVGRLGILPNFRLNRVILLGLFKCIIEFAAEIRATSILTDSFSWQIKLYSKIGFIPITNDPYISKNNSTGYGLSAQPLVLDLENMVRLEEQNTTSHEVQDILQPYVIERFFKQLVLKKIIEKLFSNSISIATSLFNFKSKLL